MRPLGGGAPFCPSDIFPVSSRKFTGQDDKKGESGQNDKIIELTSSRNCIVHQQRNNISEETCLQWFSGAVFQRARRSGKETEGKNEISISCFKKLRRFENENENE